jgi:predicted lipoprotein with Yx(FWY)xxD motif
MSYSRIRFPLLMGAMMAAALPAYSQQSSSSAPPANTPPPAAASAATTTATATAAAPAQTSTPAAAQTTASDSAPAKPSEETVKKAKSMGLHAEVRKGVTVYCWEDANTGSRFPTKKCANENQLDDIIQQRQAMQDDMRRMITNSGSK